MSLTEFKFNDEDLFEWKFLLHDSDDGLLDKEVPVVNCADLIESFTDLKDDEKKSMIDTLVLPKYQLCPNITSFRIQGNVIS